MSEQDRQAEEAPRQLRRNQVKGMLQFQKRWDERRKEAPAAPKNLRSAEGHVNVAGSAACFSSAIFTPADPAFLESIEKGVQELVLLLIEKLHCITYSSCEGHPPAEMAPMRQRHVGILPRDEKEYSRLLHFLRKTAAATRAARGEQASGLLIKEEMLATDETNLPCIEINFAAESCDYPAYRACIEPVYKDFLNRIQEEPFEP
jgi:hypothetical protein